MSDKGFKVKNGLTIQGTVDTLITADNSGGILVAGAPLSYQNIKDNGTQKTVRPTLNFVGATVTDDSANNATTITIAQSGGATGADGGDSATVFSANLDGGGSI
ncbi:MAG: hypothetical protein RIQ48_444 [Pseudomonadota bacterium]|jgi:hypothetical protein